MVEGALGAAAVVPAACVELSSPSPGNCRGTCELREAGALIPLPVVDPVRLPVAVAAEPLVAPENDDEDGSDKVGTLSGSDPTVAGSLPRAPLSVAVCASAVVRPRETITATRIARCIAFSCFHRKAAMQDKRPNRQKRR